MKTNRLIDEVLQIFKSYALASEREPLLRKLLKKAISDVTPFQDEKGVEAEHAQRIINRLAQKLNITLDPDEAIARSQILNAFYPSILTPLAQEYSARDDLDKEVSDIDLLYPSMRGKK